MPLLNPGCVQAREALYLLTILLDSPVATTTPVCYVQRGDNTLTERQLVPGL